VSAFFAAVPTANSIDQTEPFPNSYRKVFIPTTPSSTLAQLKQVLILQS
jgi:hypothetical protein